MATTTPNYGWPVPTSTDYVKDGATAIEALGDAIDATVFGLGSSALTLTNSTTVTAQSNFTINNCFSSTYQNYLIQYKFGATDQITAQFTSGGTAASGANYSYSYIYFSSSGGPTRYSTTTGTSFILSYGGFGTINVSSPNLAEATYWNAITGTSEITLNGGIHSLTTAYDGIKFTALSGTMTGTVRVYGYKN
jgi:hypothetical protein